MTEGLLVFLEARLDEDEAVAGAADLPRSAEGGDLFDGTGIIVVMHIHGGGTRSVTLPSHIARFVARYDPKRELAEVEAKRRIMDEYQRWRDSAQIHHPGPDTHAAADRLEWVCRVLAEAYGQHPDYDESWRP